MFPREAMALVGNTSWSVIYAPEGLSGSYEAGFQTWVKPRGITFVYFLVVAPGGGGSKVNNGAVTVAAVGGASGSVYSFLIPSFMLPEIIYIQPGKGGDGATFAGPGSDASPTYILANTDIFDYPDVIFLTNNSGSGSGMAANSSTTYYPFGMGLIGNFYSAGQNGASGATTSNGAGSAPTWGGGGIILGGGAGGGNGSGAGGTINTGSLDIPLISGGAGTTGGNGANGFGYNRRIALSQNTINPLPLISFTGGAGGGGHTTGQAGRGGNGGYGCGGGGGGGCTNAAGLAGNGGNGGDGLVIIGAF